MEEYAANGEGLAVPSRYQRRRFFAALILVALVMALAFALSRNRSLFPPEAIRDFFQWFAGLFQRNREISPRELPPVQQQLMGPDQQWLDLLGDIDNTLPPLWVRILLRLLRRAGIAVIAGGLALVIFGPLFSRGFFAGLRSFRPGAFLIDLWKRLFRQLRILRRLLAARLKYRRRSQRSADDDDEEVDVANPVGSYRPSLRKRRQMDRVVTVFVSVTRWGASHGLEYRRYEAATEYARRIAELYPEHYADALAVGEILCEARFSRHLVPFNRMREYVRAARKIVRA
jgi:hypothetical protein